MRSERSKVFGGNVVRTYGGRYELRRQAVDAKPGYTEGTFEPDERDMDGGIRSLQLSILIRITSRIPKLEELTTVRLVVRTSHLSSTRSNRSIC